MAYSVAVIQSGIYAQMQTAKAILLMLICVGLLSACGLKGPLYLPQDDPATQAGTEAQADEEEDEEESERDSQQVPVSSR
jgi:predicted small lipoprotein YifL